MKLFENSEFSFSRVFHVKKKDFLFSVMISVKVCPDASILWSVSKLKTNTELQTIKILFILKHYLIKLCLIVPVVVNANYIIV